MTHLTTPSMLTGEAHYNEVRPHASLGYRAPVPEVFVPALATRTATPSPPASPTTPLMASRPVMH